MARLLGPGVIGLFLAFALSFLVSISVPYITDFDDVRVFIGAPGVAASSTGAPEGALTEIRVSPRLGGRRSWYVRS